MEKPKKIAPLRGTIICWWWGLVSASPLTRALLCFAFFPSEFLLGLRYFYCLCTLVDLVSQRGYMPSDAMRGDARKKYYRKQNVVGAPRRRYS